VAAALEGGKLFNAMDACEHLGIDVPTLNGAWVAAQNAKKLVKLGGGFYCGLIEMEGKDPIYVSCPQPPGSRLRHSLAHASARQDPTSAAPPRHTAEPTPAPAPAPLPSGAQRLLHDDAREVHQRGGDHPLLRRPGGATTTPPPLPPSLPTPPRSSIATSVTTSVASVVQFDANKLPWADFRGKVLGPTDPAGAPPESLRGTLHSNWEALGLAAAPNTSDNGVHASASPFEGLAERMNWLSVAVADDVFGAALLGAGVPEETIKAWSVDPQVTIAPDKKGSLFDQLEDLDRDECLAKAAALAKM
jgi:hypothetical protein